MKVFNLLMKGLLTLEYYNFLALYFLIDLMLKLIGEYLHRLFYCNHYLDPRCDFKIIQSFFLGCKEIIQPLFKPSNQIYHSGRVTLKLSKNIKRYFFIDFIKIQYYKNIIYAKKYITISNIH